jgi:uncharacterized membrane protein
MKSGDKGLTDQQLELIVGRLLQTGVLLAVLVVLVGGAFYLAQEGESTPDRHLFHGEPPDLRSPMAIVLDALRLDGHGLIQLGILLLIATPVSRVCLSVLAFAWQRDGVFVTITLLVLAILLAGLLGVIP